MSSSPNSSSSREADVASNRAPSNRATFRDVPVVIEVLLGKGALPVRQLLRLEPGAVLRLDSAAGADLVVRATGVPMALGEVVIIEDSVAARVTHVLSPSGEAVS
jgi:flagellar motor switch protein FliN/FliY